MNADLLGQLKQKFNSLNSNRNILARDPVYNAEKLAATIQEARVVGAQIAELEAEAESEKQALDAQEGIRLKIKNLYQTLNHVPPNPARNAATLAEIRKLEAQL